MDVGRLVLFAVVARHDSITRAAAELGLSQPTVSRQISKLEHEVGARLLVRGPRGVVLSPAGAALLIRAQAIVGHKQAAERELADLRELHSGRIRLSAFPTAAATLALGAAVLLRRTAPGLRVTVDERDRTTAISAVRLGETDVAIAFSSGATPIAEPALDETFLLDERFTIALSAADPRAGAKGLSLSALAADDWIVGTRADGVIVGACRRAGFDPTIVARFDNQPAIQAAVAAGLGVTLLPLLATRHLQPGVVTVSPSDQTIRRRVSAYTLSGPRPAAVAAVLEALLADGHRPVAEPR